MDPNKDLNSKEESRKEAIEIVNKYYIGKLIDDIEGDKNPEKPVQIEKIDSDDVPGDKLGGISVPMGNQVKANQRVEFPKTIPPKQERKKPSEGSEDVVQKVEMTTLGETVVETQKEEFIEKKEEEPVPHIDKKELEEKLAEKGPLDADIAVAREGDLKEEGDIKAEQDATEINSNDVKQKKEVSFARNGDLKSSAVQIDTGLRSKPEASNFRKKSTDIKKISSEFSNIRTEEIISKPGGRVGGSVRINRSEQPQRQERQERQPANSSGFSFGDYLTPSVIVGIAAVAVIGFLAYKRSLA